MKTYADIRNIILGRAFSGMDMEKALGNPHKMHKYIKREKDPKTGKWIYWYHDPQTNKMWRLSDTEAKQAEAVGPVKEENETQVKSEEKKEVVPETKAEEKKPVQEPEKENSIDIIKKELKIKPKEDEVLTANKEKLKEILGKMELGKDITEKEQKLVELVAARQIGKEYTDIGKKFFGAKKDIAAMNKISIEQLQELEDNPQLAYKMITKDKVLGKEPFAVNTEGNPQVEFVKNEIISAIPSRPADNKLAREFYVNEIPKLVDAIKNAQSLQMIGEIVTAWTGSNGPDHETIEQTQERGKRYWGLKDKLGARFFNVLHKRRRIMLWEVDYLPKDFKWMEKKVVERTKKDVFKRPPLENIVRKGGADLGNITPEMVKDIFGHRGIEYGLWVKDAEAKEHIKRYAESIADMEQILGFDIAEYNKKEGLGIAFGSRGGGFGSAHYEPSTKVINITKTRGDGTVAHEWGHLFDNTIAKQTSGKAGYLSQGIKSGNENIDKAMEDVMDAIKEGNWQKQKVSKNETFKRYGTDDVTWLYPDETMKLYPKLTPQQTYDKISNTWGSEHQEKLAQYIMYKKGGNEITITKRTSKYYEKALNQGEYWAREQELFARAFEGYVKDKGEKIGIINNYLANVPDNDLWIPEEERKIIYPKIENLVQVIKKELKLGNPPRRGK